MSASSIDDRHARLRDRPEPTRTRTIRSEYAQRLRGAWKEIRAATRTGIIDRDVLGLQTEAFASPPTRREFEFTTDAEKVQAFDRWLQRQAEGDILDVWGGENQYIQRAYKSGIREGAADLNALGVEADSNVVTSLQRPVHKEQLQAVFTRNLGELQGMTDVVANDVRRELTGGLARGENPVEIARDLADIYGEMDDGVPRGAMARATRTARTEVMHSHNSARAVEYERHGVEEVTIILAPGACPQCVALQAGGPYPVQEGRALIPDQTHPNCKCALAPAAPS